MRTRQTYSRFIQNVLPWHNFHKGRIIQLLHHCVEHDITSFDCSDFRGREHAAQPFGVALSESGLSRDEIQLISKYGAPEAEGDKLVEKVDEILLELDTDYLDLLLLDYPHLTQQISNAVERLLSQGKILETGGLNLEESQVRDSKLRLGVNQVPSPFSTPNSLGQIPQVVNASEEIIHFVWCGREANTSQGEIQVLRDLCEKYDIPENNLYLKWILQHPAHLHPIICSTDEEGIEQDVSARQKQLDPVDWQKINLILS